MSKKVARTSEWVKYYHIYELSSWPSSTGREILTPCFRIFRLSPTISTPVLMMYNNVTCRDVDWSLSKAIIYIETSVSFKKHGSHWRNSCIEGQYTYCGTGIYCSWKKCQSELTCVLLSRGKRGASVLRTVPKDHQEKFLHRSLRSVEVWPCAVLYS